MRRDQHPARNARWRAMRGRLEDAEERLEAFEDRLERHEQHAAQLENTLHAIVRETSGIGIGGPCECGESLLIVRFDTVYCPRCGYRKTL